MTVRWNDRPELRHPAMVAAFQGWNDAGSAATDAVRWLQRGFDATECASLDPEEYLDFQAARPTVQLMDGVLRVIQWPELTFSTARTPASRDLVLLLGIEPNLKWRNFCDDVVTVARDLGCELVVTLGALLGDTPHSRPVRCTGSATDEVLAARLGMERSRYEGPTGIVGVLHDSVRRMNFASASVWAQVPHYVATPPSPKATRALLDKLAMLLDLAFDLTDLDIASSAWERSVAEVVASDSDVSGYVKRLEARYDESGGMVDEDEEEEDDEDWLDEDDLPSGDSLAEDFERYLREHGED
jgi:proteasome assembly chaperone (PAC2) family protein